MLGFFVIFICLFFQFMFLFRSDDKIKDLLLMLSYLFVLNSIVLLFGYVQTIQGATSVSYLSIFTLEASQIYPYFKISLGLALITFTLFLFKRILNSND